MTYEISHETFDVLDECAQGVDATLQAGYSGRGMYGQECVALACDDVSGLVRFTFAITYAIQNEDADVAERLGWVVDAMREARTSVDRYGTGMIYYWPTLRVTA